nr:uncharacterized protein LOC110077389 [Pogona vitticeps]
MKRDLSGPDESRLVSGKSHMLARTCLGHGPPPAPPLKTWGLERFWAHEARTIGGRCLWCHCHIIFGKAFLKRVKRDGATLQGEGLPDLAEVHWIDSSILLESEFGKIHYLDDSSRNSSASDDAGNVIGGAELKLQLPPVILNRNGTASLALLEGSSFVSKELCLVLAMNHWKNTLTGEESGSTVSQTLGIFEIVQEILVGITTGSNYFAREEQPEVQEKQLGKCHCCATAGKSCTTLPKEKANLCSKFTEDSNLQ